MLQLRLVESADGDLVWLGIDPANEQFGYAGVDRADNSCPIDSAAGFYATLNTSLRGGASIYDAASSLSAECLSNWAWSPN